MSPMNDEPSQDIRHDLNVEGIKLPQYKCHKEVWALKISQIVDRSGPEETGGSQEIHPKNQIFAPFQVSHEYMTKHKPQVGGYYVRYADGYESYSPADVFEDGYTLIS